jgi:hypothetical protein
MILGTTKNQNIVVLLALFCVVVCFGVVIYELDGIVRGIVRGMFLSRSNRAGSRESGSHFATDSKGRIRLVSAELAHWLFVGFATTAAVACVPCSNMVDDVSTPPENRRDLHTFFLFFLVFGAFCFVFVVCFFTHTRDGRIRLGHFLRLCSTAAAMAFALCGNAV